MTKKNKDEDDEEEKKYKNESNSICSSNIYICLSSLLLRDSMIQHNLTEPSITG